MPVPQWEYCSIQYQDAGSLMYYFYGQKGSEYSVLYQGSKVEKADDLTAQYVFLLGMHGWEAIQVLRRPDGMEHWYFKRQVQASNQYL